MTGPGNEDQIAFHKHDRYVARLVHRPPATAAPVDLRLRQDASYLISGGLGDLGLAVARWMVTKGARHLVLLGRKEIPPRDRWPSVDRGSPVADKIGAIQELERMGASVSTAAVDIGSETQVSAILEELGKGGRPQIRGVIHCAAVYDGAMLVNLDAGALNAVMRPKVRGAWVLHSLLEQAPLDLFVLFSAIPSLIGWVGRGAANYAAANAFLDALAYHRRAKNLPAISISWGPWDKIGIAARTEGGLNKLAHLGVGAMEPAQGLQLLERLLLENPVHAAAVQMNWPGFFQAAPDAAGAALFAELAGERAATGTQAERRGEAWSLSREKLLAAEPAERQELLESYFRERLAKVLRLTAGKLDIHQPLTEVGLDSLMAIEFRTAIQTNLGVAVPLVTFLQGPSLARLAAIVSGLMTGPADCSAVDVRVSSGRTAAAPVPGAHRPVGKQSEASLNLLSEQDVDILLESMLNENQEER